MTVADGHVLSQEVLGADHPRRHFSSFSHPIEPAVAEGHGVVDAGLHPLDGQRGDVVVGDDRRRAFRELHRGDAVPSVVEGEAFDSGPEVEHHASVTEVSLPGIEPLAPRPPRARPKSSIIWMILLPIVQALPCLASMATMKRDEFR